MSICTQHLASVAADMGLIPFRVTCDVCPEISVDNVLFAIAATQIDQNINMNRKMTRQPSADKQRRLERALEAFLAEG